MKKKSLFFVFAGITLGIIAYYIYSQNIFYSANSSVEKAFLQEVTHSQEGHKIAFGDTKDIYMMNPDGSNIEKLASAGPISGYVSWGPKAQYIYYASAKGPKETAWEAWRVNVKTKEETKISNFGFDVRSLGVSPDNAIMALSVMTGNSNIGNNNNNLKKFSTNLYTIPMSLVEEKIAAGEQIKMSDLTVLKYSPNQEQFWYEELSWNHDPAHPTLAYTKTWRYDEDAVSYTHTYTIKPDESEDTLIAENQDMPQWSFDNVAISFLGLNTYDVKQKTLSPIHLSGTKKETSGFSISPNGKYLLFELGDFKRKAGIARYDITTSQTVSVIPTGSVNVYEPRWSPIPVVTVETGNDPNFTIVPNNDGILSKFNRKVVVFGIDIYAVPTISDKKLLHVANVMAQYLDNDEDGNVDDQLVLDAMLENKAFVVMWDKESDLNNSFPYGREGQDLGNEETNPDYVSSGLTGPFDASLEEILHIINNAGHSHAYPEVFGQSTDSKLAKAMDIARGGKFIKIPKQYPKEAWYTYDDRTCDYKSCQTIEYLYWALTSLMGAQASNERLQEIQQEWKLNTKEKLQTQDKAIYELLTDPQYKMPQVLPDGTYRR